MMSQSDIVIPQIYQPLFVANHKSEEAAKFTADYKNEIRRRLIRGEYVSDDEIGVKTFVCKGGRISGKTDNDEFATIPLLWDDTPGDVWYCRSADNTIRRSIFQSMQATIRKLGFSVSNRKDTDFKVSVSPFEITCNKNGNTCQFFAINNDIDRTKAMFPPSGKLKKVILEEANEPNGEIYVEALRATALRYMDEHSKIVYRYNPPPGLNHWANRYYPGLARRGAQIIHSTWEDISQLLDPVVIADILKLKREDPVHYAYWYGGEVVSMEGLVIWSFDRTKHLLPVEELKRRMRGNVFYQPVYMFYGVDSGLKQDATAISPWALYPDGMLLKLSTFKLDIREERRKRGMKGISHTDQVLLMCDWLERFTREMEELGIRIPDRNRERWCFDGAALTQDLMLEFEKATRRECKPITDKDVERDNARLVNGYRSGQLMMLDTPENQISVKEYESFARDENNEIPEGQEDHTIDADKYATHDYYYDFL